MKLGENLSENLRDNLWNKLNDNLWNKLIAIYPFVGSTADSQAVNLKEVVVSGKK